MNSIPLILTKPTQSLFDALRLADHVSCPYERRYRKHRKRSAAAKKARVTAKSMPTLIEHPHIHTSISTNQIEPKYFSCQSDNDEEVSFMGGSLETSYKVFG
ncbi:unnamed protein product [Caenorhabditis angaria]|uniref:Uncharacterized protein n=1 Tax=Caenorhabditis angaria TaxID=860376 RepID=A0A9P1N8M5_9PELO|nr:unnamed protein product [Caenorhabditis angaria]